MKFSRLLVTIETADNTRKILFPANDGLSVKELKGELLIGSGYRRTVGGKLFYLHSDGLRYELLDNVTCGHALRENDTVVFIIEEEVDAGGVVVDENEKKAKTDSQTPIRMEVDKVEIPDEIVRESSDSSSDSSHSSDSSSSADSSSESSSSESESESDSAPEEIPVQIERATPRKTQILKQNAQSDIVTNVSIFLHDNDQFPQNARTVNDLTYPDDRQPIETKDGYQYTYNASEFTIPSSMIPNNKRKRKNQSEGPAHVTYDTQDPVTPDDLDSYPIYTSPQVGDLILYKVLELDTQLFVPKISAYKTAEIVSVKGLVVVLKQRNLGTSYKPWTAEEVEEETFNPQSRKQRPSEVYSEMFNTRDDDNDDGEGGLQQHDWSDLQDVRLNMKV